MLFFFIFKYILGGDGGFARNKELEKVMFFLCFDFFLYFLRLRGVFAQLEKVMMCMRVVSYVCVCLGVYLCVMMCLCVYHRMYVCVVMCVCE